MTVSTNCYFEGITKDGREVRMVGEFQTTKFLGARVVVSYNGKVMQLGRLTTYGAAHSQFHAKLGKGTSYTNKATGEKFWN